MLRRCIALALLTLGAFGGPASQAATPVMTCTADSVSYVRSSGAFEETTAGAANKACDGNRKTSWTSDEVPASGSRPHWLEAHFSAPTPVRVINVVGDPSLILVDVSITARISGQVQEVAKVVGNDKADLVFTLKRAVRTTDLRVVVTATRAGPSESANPAFSRGETLQHTIYASVSELRVAGR
jgi:hypothetical protein